MMYSASKLNKQGENMQPWHTPFPICNQSVVPCPVLTVASWPADFLTIQICQETGLKFFKNFPQFISIHTVKVFDVVNKAEVAVFLELSCFFNDPISSVQFSCSVMSDSLQPHRLQLSKLPCLSPIPRIYSNSCPLSGDSIQPSHPLSSPSPAFNLFQHQDLFKWVSSSHPVARILEFQL